MGDPDDTYELDELLGVYALDAVDADERRRVADYLRINPKAAAEVQAHREVATMLAFTGMDAPAELWSKITAEIEAEAPAPGPELAKVFAFDVPPPDSTVPNSIGRDSIGPDSIARGSVLPDGFPLPVDPTDLDTQRRNRRNRVGGWILAAAGVLALAVAAAVVVVGTEGPASDDLIADAYEQALADAQSVRAELVAEGSSGRAIGVIDREGHGYLDAAGLPRLAPEQTYQLWGVLSTNGDVVSLGLLGRDPTLESFTVDGGIAALAITIEQVPGVISDGNADGAFVGDVS